MTVRQYIISMLFGTVICWISWGMVLMQVNPFTSNIQGFALFYISLFFALLGTLSLITTLIIRLVTRGYAPMYRDVEKGFQYGAMIALFLLFLLYMQAQRWLNLFTFVMLMVTVVLIVLFLYTTRRPQSPVRPLPDEFNV